MQAILGPRFFERPTLLVAKALLGRYLVRNSAATTIALTITETEAYFGFRDKGSHAYRGQTARNAPMFAEAGTIYVYFTYGMHWMLNIVCEDEGYPAAVLIRGLAAPESGPPLDGPAKLTKYLGIDGSLSGKKLGQTTGLWVEDRGVRVRRADIASTPRIGIPNRGIWTQKPWRFVLEMVETAYAGEHRRHDSSTSLDSARRIRSSSAP